MKIGIDASRAFLKRRTGIEEYAYQTIRHLRNYLNESEGVILYVRRKIQWRQGKFSLILPEIDFDLPGNWKVRGIWAPRFWTQGRLSLEMLLGKRPDVLFIPAHTVPFLHPKRTIVVVHGLEYETCPEGYSLWERFYMRSSILFSCSAAEKIVSVSENTKRDLMRLYGITEKKIQVIGEGFKPFHRKRLSKEKEGDPFFLFIGRLEERKNIIRVIEAFEIFKERNALSHKLVLAGKGGYGKEKIFERIESSLWKKDILTPGYVDEETKEKLLASAEVFLFPTLYEGFGLPVLEAQDAGIPVITSDTSSLPEVAGNGALLVDPLRSEVIAAGMEKVLFNQAFRDDIIKKGRENLSRYSWDTCAREISLLLKRS